jgi:hypothetical protein
MDDMSKIAKERQRDLAVFQYIEALEAGDLSRVEAILLQADADPELFRLIQDVDWALAEEEGLLPQTSNALKIHQLIEQHLTSTFAREQENLANSAKPLTVGEVAARLKAGNKLPPAFREVNERLLKNTTSLPLDLNWMSLLALSRNLGIEISELYWKQFFQTAVALGLARSHDQAKLAARERKTGPAKRQEKE